MQTRAATVTAATRYEWSQGLSFRTTVGVVLITTFLTLANFSAAASPRDAAPAAGYNVLFIAVDDLNDWIGCLGGCPGNRSVTPNIDRLASRGVLFTRAYCAAAACNPSRAALLTGIRPATSGVYLNSQPWRAVMPEVRTLPQWFMDHGYRVAGCGKIYHGRFKDPASWQEYFARPKDPAPDALPVNGLGRTGHFDWGPVSVSDQQMGDAQVVDWAIDYLNREQDHPFFLAVGLYRPHLPWYVPTSYFGRFALDDVVLPQVPDDDLNDIPPLGVVMARPDGDHRRVTQAEQWTHAVQGYLASISFADGQVGRLLDALDQSGHANHTVIVLWGDHGWHLGEKHHWRKFSLWEEANRVPLIVVCPGTTPEGRRCVRTVSLLDLYPTLVDICDLPEATHTEGDSLRPLLKNPAATWERPALMTYGRGNHAIRDERYRYIRYRDGSEELYDHQQDPNEWANLAGLAEYADVKTRLRQWLPAIDAEGAPEQRKRGNSSASD